MKYYSFELSGVPIGSDHCGFDNTEPIEREVIIKMVDKLRLRKDPEINGRYIGTDTVKVKFLGRDYDRAKAKLKGE